MTYYRRKLPHWHPDRAVFFITFRLAGSLPNTAIEKIKSEKQLIDRKLAEYSGSEKKQSDRLSDLRKRYRLIFEKYEDHLDQTEAGPTWLSKPSIGEIVSEAVHFRDDNKYDLYAYCIMPNHVHLVIKMLKPNTDDEKTALTKTLQSLKSYTAQQANKVLNRSGQFWQHESFDRVIRDKEELESTIRYVLNNPVKANLVEEWREWPYSFCKTEFKNDLL